VPPGLCILSDEVSKQFVAAVGQHSPLRIERPLEIAAELVDVVNVARQSAPLELCECAHRKTFCVDSGVVIRMRIDPRKGCNCQDCSGPRYPNRRKQQGERREVEALIAYMLERKNCEHDENFCPP